MTVNLNPSPTQEPGSFAGDKPKMSIVAKINSYLAKYSKVPLKERLFFVQNLGIMLKASISLSKALKTLAEQTGNKFFKMILFELASKVEKGNSFSASLAEHKRVFGELFVNMVEAGEMSGKLEEVLKQLFLQMKKEHKLISKVKGAMTYPIVIICAMLGIGTFMLVFIIPKITSMFTELKAELPLPTKILISLSNAIVNNGVLSAFIFIVTIVTFIKIIKTEKGRYYFDLFLLKAPVIGPIIKKINIARFSRNISSLLRTDIMIVKTFQITANVLGNTHYKNAVNDISQKIKLGTTISSVLSQYPSLFPPMVQQMVEIGEETGEIDNILAELAEFYEEEVDQVMENLPAIIEPLLILVLGLGTGGVAVAIILPMYSITSAV